VVRQKSFLISRFAERKSRNEIAGTARAMPKSVIPSAAKNSKASKKKRKGSGSVS